HWARRRSDIRSVHDQILGVRNDMIPHRGRNFVGVAKFVLRDEVIARTSENYDLVVSVSGDVTESMGGIAMRLEVPDDRTAIVVKGELQAAVAALHFYVVKFGRVLLESAHRRSPRGSVCPCPNLLLSKTIGKRVWTFEWPPAVEDSNCRCP